MNVQSAAFAVLSATEPAEKVRLSTLYADAILAGSLLLAHPVLPESLDTPGRPAKPELALPKDVPQRKLNTPEGRAALIHAVAHIEFNAINLAWDAIYRFSGMPPQYYADWAFVGRDEAKHFSLLQARLIELGFDYGSFSAHNGLWEMARKTRGDVLVRMALVPRLLEARGLDVTPGMIAKLRQAKDEKTVAILELILAEEVRHVEIGSYWFKTLCAQRSLPAEATFLNLLAQDAKLIIRGPFNRPARLAAGFTDVEMDGLELLYVG
jgi:uncharacterized ferritin-like protein (DUF455 family)